MPSLRIARPWPPPWNSLPNERMNLPSLIEDGDGVHRILGGRLVREVDQPAAGRRPRRACRPNGYAWGACPSCAWPRRYRRPCRGSAGGCPTCRPHGPATGRWPPSLRRPRPRRGTGGGEVCSGDRKVAGGHGGSPGTRIVPTIVDRNSRRASPGHGASSRKGHSERTHGERGTGDIRPLEQDSLPSKSSAPPFLRLAGVGGWRLGGPRSMLLRPRERIGQFDLDRFGQTMFGRA